MRSRKKTTMKIESLILRGFRCFDDSGQPVMLDDFTCFVGPNASGKTSAMLALARLFGESRVQRQVIPSDFHLRPGERLEAKPSRSLAIECRLAFPELADDPPAGSPAVPETFNQMVVDEPGATPYCRIRLEATWTDDGTVGGDIEQSIWWVLTNSNDQAVIEEQRRRVKPGDRGMVRVLYVPATRDPVQQVRTTAGTSFGRLLEGLALRGEDDPLRAALEKIRDRVSKLPGVQTMSGRVQESWQELYHGSVANNVEFQAIEEDPAALVRLLVPVFKPGEGGREMSVSDLSDGLRSLFSLSLSLGFFRVECLVREKASECGFKAEIAQGLPTLTIFAVEEPENHLSPHYLGQVISELKKVGSDDGAQVLISSHSPSILRRVEPDEVRYFLGHEETASTAVRPVPLPSDESDEAYKYVREAVRGYPELYFARLVVLGEGASEEIVLRRVFQASGLPLDRQFISVVPLGGRHVNHFWRLLHGLEIPFITLLDLDREKEGAGWGRVQYVRDQLVKRFGHDSSALTFRCKDGQTVNLTSAVHDILRTKDDADTDSMKAFLDVFAQYYDVFFSQPLDLDFSMLQAFPDAYRGLAPTNGGPRLPSEDDPKYAEAVAQRMRQVLAADAGSAPDTLGSTYADDQRGMFAWYKYLFVDGSKPVAHMRALLDLSDKELNAHAPETLKRLVARARALVTPLKEGG
jgi:hypothetical protein